MTPTGPSGWRVGLGLGIDDEIVVSDGLVADCELENAVENEPAAG